MASARRLPATQPRRVTGWCLAARSEKKLADLAEELGGPERAIAVRCDVTEWADQEALAKQALDEFGQIDVAFANAGFGAKRGFLEETPELWRDMVLTNVYGAALTSAPRCPPSRTQVATSS